MKKVIILIFCFAFLYSCKDATQAQYNALGKPHIIKQYGCDGKIINQWESTGSVSNEAQSDGWYFEEVSTGKLVEVTGTIVITVK